MENDTKRPTVETDNKDNVSQLFDRLQHILKDTQASSTKLQSNESLDNIQYGNTKLPTANENKFTVEMENDLDMLDNGDTPRCDENTTEEFYDCKNESKLLKDIAHTNKSILENNNKISQPRIHNVSNTSCEDGSNCTTNNTLQSKHISTHFEGLNLGINELFLIVQEYEQLKEKYIKLETDVGSTLSCNKKNEQHLDHNSNISLEKVNVLHIENQRLSDEIEFLNMKNKDNERLQNALQNTIARLESAIEVKQRENMVAVDKLSAHDAAAKRAISVLQKEMEARVEEVNKRYETSLSEKDSHIIKISKLESNIVELKHNNTSQQRRLLDQDAELERVKSFLKMKETDHAKLISMNEQFEKDIVKLTKRIECHKEEMEGQEIKVKWSQNKLKTELESHKETKKHLATVTNKLQEAKEEGEQIRKNCQEMIERYQGDEEINSVSLRKQLEIQGNKKKELERVYQQQNNEFQEQENQMKLIREENKKLIEQIQDEKAAVIAVEGKNKELTCQLVEKEKDFAEMKTSIETLKEEIKELQQLQGKVRRYENEIEELKKEVEEVTGELNECLSDLKQHKEQQHEMLQYSQSLTESDVHAKASLNELQSKLDKTIAEKEENCMKFNVLEKDMLSKIQDLKDDKKVLHQKLQDLTSQLEEKSTAVNEISSELEETRNELKVTKKKNASQMKDLQRELNQTTKKIEQLEAHSNGSLETLSNRSRTSSCNSLEKIQGRDSPSYSTSPSGSSSPQLSHKSVVIPQDHYVTQPNRANLRANNAPQELEIDKKVVEKICKLQKTLAKKTEKIEFLEDHNRQLTEALQNKSKVIQHYFLRQEPGLIAPDKFDVVKSNISQYGGIMSSVYSAKPNDKAMTLDLSLAINSKLQAVLEDTVLKNITLQDSLNTLGTEIAKFQAAGITKPP